MALFENGFKGNIFAGLAIGIGTAIVAPMIIPALSQAMKPLARAAVKSGLMLYESGKEKFAEVSEIVEDMVAEARAEMTAVQGEVTQERAGQEKGE